MKNLLRQLIRQENGQDLIEYGLLAAFISVVAITTIKLIGPVAADLYDLVLAALTPK